LSSFIGLFLNKAAEIKYGKIPQLEKEIKEANTKLQEVTKGKSALLSSLVQLVLEKPNSPAVSLISFSMMRMRWYELT